MNVLDKLPFYTYATTKYLLSKIPLLQTHSTCLVSCSFLLSLLIIPIFALFLSLTLLYRKLIDLTLYYQLHPKYRGLLKGVDTICCNQEVCTPSFFLLVDYQKCLEDLKRDFITLLSKCCYSRHEKLFFSRSSFAGYHYFYKNSLKLDNYITLAEHNPKVEVIRNKKDFADAIIQYDIAKMPDDDHALFHIIIYPQKVELPNVEGTKLVCFKMHHCLADGKAMIGWMMADLSDKTEVTQNGGYKLRNEINGYQNNQQNGCLSRNKSNYQIDDFMNKCKKALFDDKIKVLPTDCHDDNILIGRSLCEEKFICWFSDFSSEYLDKVKCIKRSKPGVTFLDVINTCISSSLQQYYEKHSKNVPEVISGGVVLSPDKYSFRYGDALGFEFSNEFSVGGFNFPIVMTSKTRNRQEEILAKFNFCQKEYQVIKESLDVKYFYWVANLLSLIPYQLPTYFTKFLQITIGVSSLPGADKIMSLFGGNTVKDIILMAPNSPGTALHFVSCSYVNRLHISLTIDKSVVGKFEDAQEIIESIIDNIDFLYNIVEEQTI